MRTGIVYPSAKERFLTGRLDMIVDPLYAVLVNFGGSINRSHEYLADIAGLIAGAPHKMVGKDVRGGRFTAAPLVFDPPRIQDADGLVIYHHVTQPDDSPLIVAFTGVKARLRAGTVPVHWDPEGIFEL